jgi:cyclic pyranopterin phosphate synthase
VMIMPIIDSHGRRINYLRLSVTDRCNMRCRYCMPQDGIPKLEHNDILSYEQLYSLSQAAVSLGIEKIRVTGGEPLVRKGIVDFLAQLSELPGLKQLVMTTNGLLLPEMAADLKRSGVQRLNISLDTLRPDVFRSITRRDGLDRVLAGISAAEEAGIPIKLNMVVMRGVNDAELVDFAAMTMEKNISVRFIEYMPAIKEEGWQSLVMPGEDILARIAEQYPFSPVISGELDGPARVYKVAGSQGTIGVITALSGHFCADCNRIRITASGKVRSCLFANDEFDLTQVLADGDSVAIQAVLRKLVAIKPAMHAMNEQEAQHTAFTMAQIGG